MSDLKPTKRQMIRTAAFAEVEKAIRELLKPDDCERVAIAADNGSIVVCVFPTFDLARDYAICHFRAKSDDYTMKQFTEQVEKEKQSPIYQGVGRTLEDAMRTLVRVRPILVGEIA